MCPRLSVDPDYRQLSEFHCHTPHPESLERALALSLVISECIVHLMRMGRTCPDLDAEQSSIRMGASASICSTSHSRLARPERLIARGAEASVPEKAMANQAPSRSGRDCVVSVPPLIPSRPFVKWVCWRVLYNEVRWNRLQETKSAFP